MNTSPVDLRFVRLEIESRYGRWIGPRVRSDSSLETLRRTLRRDARAELHPGER